MAEGLLHFSFTPTFPLWNITVRERKNPEFFAYIFGRWPRVCECVFPSVVRGWTIQKGEWAWVLVASYQPSSARKFLEFFLVTQKAQFCQRTDGTRFTDCFLVHFSFTPTFPLWNTTVRERKNPKFFAYIFGRWPRVCECVFPSVVRGRTIQKG